MSPLHVISFYFVLKTFSFFIPKAKGGSLTEGKLQDINYENFCTACGCFLNLLLIALKGIVQCFYFVFASHLIVLMLSFQTAMAHSTTARLKVILGDNNIEKLTLPNGIPESLDDLIGTIRSTFGLKCSLKLQYMDQDFGNDFFNLKSTAELQDLGTIKVIQQTTLISATASSASVSSESDDCVSLASNDTILLSSPESLSSRTKQWPEEFPIPQFSYDTELQLVKGNSECQVGNKLLTLSSRIKSDILNRVVEEIYRYKAYPEDAHFCTVAEALIKKHPCLKEPGSFNGCYGWKQRLKYKMGNYRTQLKVLGCAELSVNSLRSKSTMDAFPAKKVKRPKRAKANFYPSFPTGETQDSMEKERIELLTDVKRRNNERVITKWLARLPTDNMRWSTKNPAFKTGGLPCYIRKRYGNN